MPANRNRLLLLLALIVAGDPIPATPAVCPCNNETAAARQGSLPVSLKDPGEVVWSDHQQSLSPWKRGSAWK
jgi:hypothetical protein